MAVEVQLSLPSFKQAIANMVQDRLYYACFPAQAGVFVDHVDVSGLPEVLPGDGGTIIVRLAIDVYLVNEQELEAFKNQDQLPPDAAAPRGRLSVDYRISISGTELSIILDDGPHSVPPNPVFDALLNSMRGNLPAIPPVPFDGILTSLGAPLPTVSGVELLPEILTIRFDPSGPAVPHLFPGQEWGVYIDGPGVESLILSRLPGRGVPGLTRTPRWTPMGNLPRVTVNVRLKPDLPDGLSAEGNGVASANLTVVATQPAALRVTINWSPPVVDLGPAVPGFLDNAVERIVREFLDKTFDPGRFGGTKIDARSFFIDIGLPTVALAGAMLEYRSLVSDQSGMTLGGRVRQMHVESGTLRIDVTPFGRPTVHGTCRHDGEPPKRLDVTQVRCLAGVSISSYGAFCGVTLLTAGPADRYLDSPANGDRSETITGVSFDLPGLVAIGVTDDVEFIIRTSRGVRYINLGHPVIEFDEKGNVIFTPQWVWDCLTLTPEDQSAIDFAKGKGGSADSLKKPPFEDPNWASMLAGGRGFGVQLISLNRLQPGELLRYRSISHDISVSADSNGNAVVPIFYSFTEDSRSMRLERINRQSLDGRFNTRARSFVRHARLDEGTENNIEEGIDGGVTLTRVFGREVRREEFTSDGIRIIVDVSSDDENLSVGGEEVALNPQPLPPKEMADIASRLPGVLEVIPIPGFEDEPLAVARMADDSAVLLELDSSGDGRVAGSFSGPIGKVATAGSWGLATAANRAFVFKVGRD
ncbi:hypothetical protein C8K38_103222 [Rhodococcus sp. OK611]|uniref:hypothetical protein n=1 Tax=unclassified Rhodococcus (in: high G+C Gram-positive bacteria) TaxID=192944 RepID=UPI000BDCBE15|nr:MULTISPECIES: hypothetical protein [unclassified Rhodococcus (in: high G+C Gram-positive bacteria)]PTR44725.1 hypothetical protein C8K38_103222 [Rhodococcus sp. OK611]SNX90166.1 hypothetical protein SAMN05447004_104222 [Rhodococcus sp. OK270]